MRQERYDIEAGKNVLTMLRNKYPNEHARLMARLKANVGLAGLGEVATTTTAEESQPGFWTRLFTAGGNALMEIADYKLTTEVTRQTTTSRQRQQLEYEEAVAAEMERQALLAARAQTQALEYQNQIELARQQADLQLAASSAKSRLGIAAIGIAALLGLWIFARMAT